MSERESVSERKDRERERGGESKERERIGEFIFHQFGIQKKISPFGVFP